MGLDHKTGQDMINNATQTRPSPLAPHTERKCVHTSVAPHKETARAGLLRRVRWGIVGKDSTGQRSVKPCCREESLRLSLTKSTKPLSRQVVPTLRVALSLRLLSRLFNSRVFAGLCRYLKMEFIGLALGIAPLFIELLKAKPEPVHALKATNKESAKEMMAEFYRDLHYEVTMLRITLTGLVNELPIKADLKEKLTNEKSLGATVWKKPPPELQSALERRLSPCYDSFVHSMEKVLKLLESLVDDKSLPLALAEDEAVGICLPHHLLMLTNSSGTALMLHMRDSRSSSKPSSRCQRD